MPVPHQEERVGHADGQQHVERAAGHIDPERAHGLRRRAGEAADQGDRKGDAGRGRQEVLVRQAQHLRQVGQRAFAAVALPVGVGDEAGRGVEGEVRRDGALAGRIEGQHILEAEQGVQDQEPADMEEHHGDEVGDPALLLVLVDPGNLVEDALDGAQDRRQEGALAREDARHVAPEGLRECDDDRAVQRDLYPTYGRHDGTFQNRSGRTSA